MITIGGWSYSPETEEIRRKVRKVICVWGGSECYIILSVIEPHSIIKAGGQLDLILKRYKNFPFIIAFKTSLQALNDFYRDHLMTMMITLSRTTVLHMCISNLKSQNLHCHCSCKNCFLNVGYGCKVF